MFGEVSAHNLTTAPNQADAGRLLSPGQIWRQAVGLYWRNWPEFTAVAALGYGLLVVIALSFAAVYNLLANRFDFLLPLLFALGLVGGLAGAALIHMWVLATVAHLILTERRYSLGYTFQQVRGQAKNLSIAVFGLLALAVVMLMLAGIPILGWLTAPGMLVFLAVIGSLAPAALVAEGLPGAWAIAQSWRLARPHFWRSLLAIGPMMLAGLLLFALPTLAMVALRLPLQLIDLWLPLLLGLFFTPIYAATAALTYLDLRRRTPESTFQPGFGRMSGLVSLAELGKFALLSLAVTLLAALLTVAGYAGALVAPATLAESAAQEAIGTAAPDFKLASLDGRDVSLGQLAGKPTVINFWATWCVPCKEELPVLQQSYRENGQHINFLAISVKEDETTVRAFVQTEGLALPVALDVDGAVVNDYLVRGLPTTIILNADGVIVARHLGGVTADTLEAYLAPLLNP